MPSVFFTKFLFSVRRRSHIPHHHWCPAAAAATTISAAAAAAAHVIILCSPSDPENFLFVVIGNKIDVDGGNSRVVSEKKARAWCASKGNIPYIETLAKEGINIEDAFQVIAKNALKTGEEEEIYLPDTIDVGSSSQQRSSGCEC
ncbi:RAS-related GTP-binding family protein [Dorcoceras hygrometricum]|uniref:RAS-related GTP-binding family protein n=1 Tax=Dorcoceras hygrometricum TaxID=472368 RepID=A0A2Z7BQJ8_9LAMI|nr:RAS-related GTP-binding family protein [Dorcoceras hygrometricum]